MGFTSSVGTRFEINSTVPCNRARSAAKVTLSIVGLCRTYSDKALPRAPVPITAKRILAIADSLIKRVYGDKNDCQL